MTAAVLHAAATTRSVPYDLQAALADAQWRSQIDWPLALPVAYAAGERCLNGLVTVIRDEADAEVRDILVVAGVRALVLALAQNEAALTLSAARTAGLRMAYQEPELAYLDGQVGAATPGSRDMPAHYFQVPRLRRLREMRGTLRWCGPVRAAKSWIAPQATVISENRLLHDAARHASTRLDLRYVQHLYRDIMAADGDVGDTDKADAATDALVGLLTVEGADDDIAERQQQLCRRTVRGLCRRAARDLAAARHLKLPKHVWAASGGPWPNRIISREILRRGGTVTRFDHGGGRGLNLFPAWPVVMDFPLSTRFVMASDGLAQRMRSQGVEQLVPPDEPIEILGHQGDPSFAHLPAVISRRRPQRPRVLYAPGLFRGLRQTVPAQMPDVLYLDWQLRLVEQLQRLPIDLVCRPHPNMRALGSGRPHPLAALVPPSPLPFEASLPEVDVVLLDQPHSTTFYSAVCTDRPVVLIDFGTPYFDAAAQSLVDRRCRVIATSFDDRNRPIVDLDALADALLGEPGPVDNTAFRDLLIGDLADR